MNHFESLPNHSKVWIFQSNKQLKDNEKNMINEETELFLNSWQSHGQKMNAWQHLFFDYFLVVALDDSVAGASGCGIDKLVHFINNLGQKLNVDFFNRLNICYTESDLINLNTNNLAIKQIHFSNIEQINFSAQTKIFNNAITTKHEFENSWIQPISKSWLAKHIEPLAQL